MAGKKAFHSVLFIVSPQFLWSYRTLHITGDKVPLCKWHDIVLGRTSDGALLHLVTGMCTYTSFTQMCR